MQIKKGLFVDKYPLCVDILQPFIYKKAPKSSPMQGDIPGVLHTAAGGAALNYENTPGEAQEGGRAPRLHRQQR